MAIFGVKLVFSLLLIVIAVSFVTCLEDETVIPTTDSSVTTSQPQPKESRIVGPRGKGWKHFLLPFLMGVTLKVSTLVPVVLMSMTMLGGLALIVSKMALLMAALTAGHQYFTKEEKVHHIHQPDLFPAQAYPIPSLDQSGHGAASDPYQQYAAASSNSASYPTGYAGSYSPNQYYRRVIYNKR